MSHVEYWEDLWSEYQANYPTENMKPGEQYSAACHEFKKGLIIFLHLSKLDRLQNIPYLTNMKSMRAVLNNIAKRMKEENAENEYRRLRDAKITVHLKRGFDEMSEDPDKDCELELPHDETAIDPLKKAYDELKKDCALHLAERDRRHDLLYFTNMQRMLDVIVDVAKRMNREDPDHAAVINRGVDHWDHEFGRLCDERIFGELEDSANGKSFAATHFEIAKRLLEVLVVADILLSDDELPDDFGYITYGFPPDHVRLSDELPADFGVDDSE